MALQRIHTDLALEAKEKFEEDNVEIRGVVIEEDLIRRRISEQQLCESKQKTEQKPWEDHKGYILL